MKEYTFAATLARAGVGSARAASPTTARAADEAGQSAARAASRLARRGGLCALPAPAPSSDTGWLFPMLCDCLLLTQPD
jgi:hypothetical protein